MARSFVPFSEDALAEKMFQALQKHEDFEELKDYGKEIDPASFAELYTENTIGGTVYKGFNYTALRAFKSLTPTIEKDIKVTFDTENVLGPGDGQPGDPPYGFHTLDNGLSFFGLAPGGDWEFPVYFIIYWDGSKLRAYVPTDGNPYNTSTMWAYGNDGESDKDGESDAVNVRKRYPGVIPDPEEGDEDDYIDVHSVVDFEWPKMEADIKARILLKIVTLKIYNHD